MYSAARSGKVSEKSELTSTPVDDIFLATPDIYSGAKRQWNLNINADLTKDASEWHVINESSVGATCVNSSKLQISKGNDNKDATLRGHVQNPVQNIIIVKIGP